MSVGALVPSPRDAPTDRAPMEFTSRQFWRGAWAAWVIFMALLVLWLIVTGLVQADALWGPPGSMIMVSLIYGVPIGGLVSALTLLVGAPVSWQIGRRLRHIERMSIHLVAHAAAGAVLGALVALALGALSNARAMETLASAFGVMMMSACALSVAGGWTWTFLRARREAAPWPPAVR